MASVSGVAALCLGLALCGCAEQKPATAPVVIWQAPQPSRPAARKRLPVKKQIEDIQSRVDALEDYLRDHEAASQGGK